jgi:hypothetical protein
MGHGFVDVSEILCSHTHLRIYVFSCIYLCSWCIIICQFISIIIFSVSICLLSYFWLINAFTQSFTTIGIFRYFHAHVVHLEHLLIRTSTAKPLNHVDSSALFPVLPPFRESRRKHTYLLDPFDLLLPVDLPVPNVVGRLPTLESF